MAELENSGIRYLIVGGMAVGFYAEPRFTKDLDVLIGVLSEDSQKLYDLLGEFGAPISLIAPHDFSTPDFIFYFGAPPWRIDLITSIPGVDFEEVYARRELKTLAGKSVSCISKQDLINAKEASGRHQDLADVEKLKDT